MKANDKKYAIIQRVDPYNAKFHYHGQKVVERDGFTPVAWIVDEIESKDEALAKLRTIAETCSDSHCHFDDDDVREIVDEAIAGVVFDDDEEKADAIEKAAGWYKGPGVYEDRSVLVLADGGESFSHDVSFYSIEEIENE